MHRIFHLLDQYTNDVKGIKSVFISDRMGNIIIRKNYGFQEERSENGNNITGIIHHPDNNDSQIYSKNVLKSVLVSCPVCKTQKYIDIPENIVNKAKSLTTISIPRNLVCDHVFHIYLDKNYIVRGEQVVHYEFDGYLDNIISEVSSQNNFCNIMTVGEIKIAYCSMGPKSIITTIAIPSVSDIQLRIYSEYLAGKIESILDGSDDINLEIPETVKIMAKTKTGQLPKGEFESKVILTGDYSVGKTSIMKRFTEGIYVDEYIPSVGIDVKNKFIDIEDTKIKFIVWDIGGQVTHMIPYRKNFFGGAKVAIIIIDRTRPKTLERVSFWHGEIKKGVRAEIPILILGNKSDLIDKCIVTEEEIKKMAESINSAYFLVSAKTGENVHEAFLYLALEFIRTIV